MGAGVSDWTEAAEIETAARGMVLAPAIDPATREALSVVKSAGAVPAIVAFLFTVHLGAGIALGQLGENFAAIENVNAATKRAIQNEIRRILQPVVAAGWVRILRIDVVVVESSGYASVTTFYRDLLVGREAKPISRQIPLSA